MNLYLQNNIIFKIIFTAILYYAGNIIGIELTSSTSTASFFWPSAGIALGAVFMFGPFATVGIIVGAIFSQLFLVEELRLSALLFSLVPALQAYITYKILNPLFNHSFSLITEKDIIRFFSITPLFSLISSLTSALILYLAHDISDTLLFSTWFTYWVGNSFGVLIITPLFFALFSPAEEWQQRRLTVGLALLVLTIVCFSIMRFAQNRDQEQLTQKLLHTNQTLNAKIEDTLKQYEKNLQAINIFFLSTYHATPNEINGFLRKLNFKKDDASYGYGWFGFADLINTKTESQYTFHTLKPYQFKLDNRPINVIQDQYEECTLGSYLEVHKNKDHLYSLYRNIEASISSIDNLCASEHLGGVAYVDIDLNHLLLKAAQQLDLDHVSIQLFGTKNNQPTLLFERSHHDFFDSNKLNFTPEAQSLMTYKNTFWTLKLKAHHHYVSLNSSWNTWWLLLISLLFTAASSLGLLTLTAKKLYIESIVDKKSIQLQHINNQLSEQIQQQQEQQILIKMQSRVLEMIAKDEPLESILNQLCLYAENQVYEGASASITSYDKSSNQMTLAASPTMPSDTANYFSNLNYNDNLNPSVDALKTEKQQIVEKIDGTLRAQLNDTQSYWATPILSHQNEILGVLTITLSESRSPSQHEQQLMSVTASLACISFERHNNNKQLNKLSNAVESSPNGIVITSLKGVIEYANPYFCDYIGLLEHEIKGHYLTQYVQDATDSSQQDFDWDYCLSLGESQREYMGIKPNGDVYWCKQTIASMYDKLEGSQHVLSIHQDITEEHTAHQFLKQQASHDSLTGLYNLAEFEFQLNKLIDRPYNGNNHSIAHLDLDGFKAINDQCGHAAGDQLLRAISELMENQLRRTDFLARVGGDEFKIILEQCPAKKAKAILNGLIQAISDYEFIWDKTTYNISASIGLVEINEQDLTIDELLTNVHTACYLAKEEGKQHVHLYHIGELEKHIDIVKHNWLDTLNNALSGDHFILFVQPILDLETNSIDQYEILLHLRGEHSEIIHARSFLNDAERLNLMPKIDRWVITKLFKWMNTHPNSSTRFAINLSGQTLDITFMPWLNQMLRKHQIDPQRLCFELTEKIALIDYKNTQKLIQPLSNLGCRIALEDFGSDLSSFTNLKNLTVDYVKIDGTIVKNIEQNLIDRSMVKSINELIHLMGKKTIADYAANNAIHDLLKGMGIDYIQGASVAIPFELSEL